MKITSSLLPKRIVAILISFDAQMDTLRIKSISDRLTESQSDVLHEGKHNKSFIPFFRIQISEDHRWQRNIISDGATQLQEAQD